MKLILIILGMCVVLNCNAYKIGDKVELGSSKECPACQVAKELLKDSHIPYKEVKPSNKDSEYIPQLYVNGKFVGYGIDVIKEYVK